MNDRPPNALGITNDYSKTIVTLALGLLGLTVTLSPIESQGPSLRLWAWPLLLLAVLSSLLCMASISNAVRDETGGSKWPYLWANVSYFALFGASLALVVNGFTESRATDRSAPANAARRALAFTATVSPRFVHPQVAELVWEPSTRVFRVKLTEPSGTDSVYVVFDPVSGQVESFSRGGGH